MEKLEYLPVGDGTVAWAEVNEKFINTVSNMNIDSLIEKFTRATHENEKICIVNRLSEFDSTEVGNAINECKSFVNKRELIALSELEKMINN